ncbi:Fanconi anemia group C protein [Rhinophrynus dorsalis]
MAKVKPVSMSDLQCWLNKAVEWGRTTTLESQQDVCLHLPKLWEFLLQIYETVKHMSPSTAIERFPIIGQLFGRLCWNPFVVGHEDTRKALISCLCCLHTHEPQNAIELRASNWVQTSSASSLRLSVIDSCGLLVEDSCASSRVATETSSVADLDDLLLNSPSLEALVFQLQIYMSILEQHGWVTNFNTFSLFPSHVLLSMRFDTLRRWVFLLEDKIQSWEMSLTSAMMWEYMKELGYLVSDVQAVTFAQFHSSFRGVLSPADPRMWSTPSPSWVDSGYVEVFSCTVPEAGVPKREIQHPAKEGLFLEHKILQIMQDVSQALEWSSTMSHVDALNRLDTKPLGAEKNRQKTCVTSFWHTVIWIDETKIELYSHNHKRSVWRGVNKAYSEMNTIPTVKHGGGSLMFSGCVSSRSTWNLVKIDGKMNAVCYQKILADNLHSSPRKLHMGLSWTFQHDNDPKHKAKLTHQWLQQKKLKVLKCPSQSPDLNIIEPLWGDPKHAVHAWRHFAKTNGQLLSADQVCSMSVRCIPVLLLPDVAPLLEALLTYHGSEPREVLDDHFLDSVNDAILRKKIVLSDSAVLSLWLRHLPSLEKAVLDLFQRLIAIQSKSLREIEEIIKDSFLPQAACHPSIFMIVDNIFRNAILESDGNIKVMTVIRSFTHRFIQVYQKDNLQARFPLRAYFPYCDRALVMAFLRQSLGLPQDVCLQHLLSIIRMLRTVDNEKRSHGRVFETWFLLIHFGDWVDIAAEQLLTSGSEISHDLLWLLAFYYNPCNENQERGNSMVDGKAVYNHLIMLHSSKTISASAIRNIFEEGNKKKYHPCTLQLIRHLIVTVLLFSPEWHVVSKELIAYMTQTQEAASEISDVLARTVCRLSKPGMKNQNVIKIAHGLLQDF